MIVMRFARTRNKETTDGSGDVERGEEEKRERRSRGRSIVVLVERERLRDGVCGYLVTDVPQILHVSIIRVLMTDVEGTSYGTPVGILSICLSVCLYVFFLTREKRDGWIVRSGERGAKMKDESFFYPRVHTLSWLLT